MLKQLKALNKLAGTWLTGRVRCLKTGQLLKGHHVTLLGRFGYYQIKLEQSLRVSAACGLSEGRLAIMNSIAVQRSSGQVSTSNAPSVAQQSRQIPVCTPGRNPWLAPWSPVGRSGMAVQSSPAHVRRRGDGLISGALWTPDLVGEARHQRARASSSHALASLRRSIRSSDGSRAGPRTHRGER